MNLNRIFLVTTFLSLLNSTNLFAQQGIIWQNSIGGNDIDWFYSLEPTIDGGYICGGYSISDSSGDRIEICYGLDDYWFLKLDSIGNIQWQNVIGGSLTDRLTSMKPTSDGGYICGGYSNSNISFDKTENSVGQTDYWVIRLDYSGNIIWQNTIGGSWREYMYDIIQTTDGGFICAGFSNSIISGDKTETTNGDDDYWVVKLDANGNIQWQNTIGGNHDDRLLCIIQTADGGYICGGASESDISGDKTEICQGFSDYWIVKLDVTGNIQWQNTIGGSSWDELTFVVETSDNGFMCGGGSLSGISGDKTENSNGDFDYWIVKLDNLGNIQWQNTIGGSLKDMLYSIRQTSDGGYICGGESNSNITGDKTESNYNPLSSDYWVLKLDSTGLIQSQNTIGGNAPDRLMTVRENADGSYSCGGYSLSGNSGDKTEPTYGERDYWIMNICFNSSISLNIAACNSFVSPSGNYVWNSSGTYHDTISNVLGCDSIITVNLTITNFVASITAQSSTVFCRGDSVILSAIPGMTSYQWYRWNAAIPGANSENYTAKVRGKYKCLMENSIGCSDTSNIINVSVPCIPIGPNHERIASTFESDDRILQLSPNPGSGIFTLHSQPGQLRVYNSTGELILSMETVLTKTELDLSEFADGIYYVTLNTDDIVLSQKIVLSR